MGMILPVFQILGIFALESERLIIAMRNSTPHCPSCLSIIGEISSGPAAFEFFELRMACFTANGVKVTGCPSEGFLIFRRTLVNCLRRSLSVLLMAGWGVNCLKLVRALGVSLAWDVVEGDSDVVGLWRRFGQPFD